MLKKRYDMNMDDFRFNSAVMIAHILYTVRKHALVLRVAGLLVVTILIPCTVFSDSNMSETGKTGLSFLNIAPSSRISSLGSAAIAYRTGASSLWSNPSLIAFDEQRSAQFTHIEWIEGIKQEYAAFSSKLSKGSVGVGIQLFDSGDIEGRDEFGDNTGMYSIVNVALSLGYAYTVTDWMSVGLTYKKLFQKISDEAAGGNAFDFGLTFKTPVKGLSFAASGRNYGRMDKLKNTRTNLPSNVALGCSYTGTAAGIVCPYALLADVIIPRYGDTGIRLGTEILPVEYLALRVGYRNDSEFEDFSYGVGLNWERVSVDLAYSPMSGISDNALRFTLSLTGF